MTLFPIVERELQVAARMPATYRTRFFAALTFLAIWVFMLIDGRHSTPTQTAQQQFGLLSSLGMVLTLGAGVFLTSDCLSREKREGTLGLLFLTDLRGFDVVLGKLVANSLQSLYSLLSVLPILALPLLMGGVTPGEFWREVLVLLTCLFLSLTAGMVVSAFSRDARQAMAGTIGIVILLTGMLPAVAALIEFFGGGAAHLILQWPCPVYLTRLSGDAAYLGHKSDFWRSMATILGISLGFLITASLFLPRAWHERGESRKTARRSVGNFAGWRFGKAAWRQRFRLRALSLNPYYWLAARDRLPQIILWFLLFAAIPIWVMFAGSAMFLNSQMSRNDALTGCIFTTFVFQLIFKLTIAGESSRRLSDDRESGALELMLVTPLPVKAILDGQKYALIRQFRVFMFALIMLYALQLLVVLGFDNGPARSNERGLFTVMFIGNIVVLFSDFGALMWLGMWNGMKMRHQRAILMTYALIIVPGWLLYILLGTCGMFNGGSNGVAFGFGCWFVLCLICDLFWIAWSRGSLIRHFRDCAAGINKEKRRIQVFRETPEAREIPQT